MWHTIIGWVFLAATTLIIAEVLFSFLTRRKVRKQGEENFARELAHGNLEEAEDILMHCFPRRPLSRIEAGAFLACIGDRPDMWVHRIWVAEHGGEPVSDTEWTKILRWTKGRGQYDLLMSMAGRIGKTITE